MTPFFWTEFVTLWLNAGYKVRYFYVIFMWKFSCGSVEVYCLIESIISRQFSLPNQQLLKSLLLLYKIISNPLAQSFNPKLYVHLTISSPSHYPCPNRCFFGTRVLEVSIQPLSEPNILSCFFYRIDCSWQWSSSYTQSSMPWYSIFPVHHGRSSFRSISYCTTHKGVSDIGYIDQRKSTLWTV